MDMNVLFTAALGLQSPWKVTGLQFDPARKRLDIRVDFPAGSRFPCPKCGDASKVHDAPEHEWRHLNFFEHEAYLQARQPRTKCERHGVKQISVPWARPGSGFTLLMEALLLELVRSGMPVAAVARLAGEHDTRLWRLLQHYVGHALKNMKLDALTTVGLDETSRARGHRYLTLFVDLAGRRVVFIALDRDHETLAQFRDWIVAHGGDPNTVKELSLDMSPAYVKGAGIAFPEAELTFDKFHVVALANAAIDQVRRQEQLHVPELKKSRWLWLKNELTQEQRERFEAVRTQARRTARAYHYREMLQDLYRQPDEDAAQQFFTTWYRAAVRSRLAPVVRVARTLREHSRGVLRWFRSRITNGLLEGMSSLVQASKNAARGYRNADYMATIIYLRMGKLDLKSATSPI
jgi:transposase